MTVSSSAPRSTVVLAPISHVVADAHAAELGNLDPGSVVVGDAESVGADHHPGMDERPCSDMHAPADHHCGRDVPVRSDRRTPAEERTGVEKSARPDARPGFDHAMGADRCVRRYRRAGIDNGAGRDPGLPLDDRRQQRGGARVAQIRIVEHERRHRADLRELRSQNHCARFRALQVGTVAAIRQERDRARSGCIQNRHSIDGDVGIAEQFGPDPFGKFPESVAQGAASAMRPTGAKTSPIRAFSPRKGGGRAWNR